MFFHGLSDPNHMLCECLMASCSKQYTLTDSDILEITEEILFYIKKLFVKIMVESLIISNNESVSKRLIEKESRICLEIEKQFVI